METVYRRNGIKVGNGEKGNSKLFYSFFMKSIQSNRII
jgi:hypothetical protein